MTPKLIEAVVAFITLTHETITRMKNNPLLTEKLLEKIKQLEVLITEIENMMPNEEDNFKTAFMELFNGVTISWNDRWKFFVVGGKKLAIYDIDKNVLIISCDEVWSKLDVQHDLLEERKYELMIDTFKEMFCLQTSLIQIQILEQ